MLELFLDLDIVSELKNGVSDMIKKRLKKGFTLVELLVVISIIALLVSILMPALGKVRSQGKKVLCATTLHQWGIALTLYAADNENYFPYNGNARPGVMGEDGLPEKGTFSLNWCGGAVQQFWRDYLIKNNADILKDNYNILFCPTVKSAVSTYGDEILSNGQCGFFLLPHMERTRASFQMTYDPPGNPNGIEWMARKKFDSKYRRAPVAGDLLIKFVDNDSWAGAHLKLGRAREPGGGNVLLEDGHVEWFELDSLGVGAIYRGWTPEHHSYYKIPGIK